MKCPLFFLTGEQEIKALKVKCNNDGNGCGWTGELRSLDNHLTTCGYALLRCTNKCTNNMREKYLLRRDMDNHLKNTCPNRQYRCPHCKDTGRHREITTTHLDTCLKLKVSCPNVGCNDSVPRCELSDHQTKCLFEKVPCKYAELGCEEKPLRKDLQQHENNDTFHLHLAIETVHKQQKEMKAMKKEQTAMKREMKVEIIVTETSPCVFKMPNFNQHQTSKQVWYSPPFYIHSGSYKMCVRVYANGCSDGKGTHVSVFACLTCGRNDENFRGEVTITLLNQLADNFHHTKNITYDDKENSRVVDGCHGWAKFISNDQLRVSTWLYYQYLKDDCLYFRITAKPHWLTCTT